MTTWGSNEHGQLGLGSTGGVRDTPEMLTCLNGIPVAQVVAGGNHSFTLSMSGAIHGWGKNRYGASVTGIVQVLFFIYLCNVLFNSLIERWVCFSIWLISFLNEGAVSVYFL